LILTLPNALQTSSTGLTTVGGAYLEDAGVAARGGVITVSNASSVTLYSVGYSTASSLAAVSFDQPWTWGGGDFIRGSFEIPILGWSSNTVMSSEVAVAK